MHDNGNPRITLTPYQAIIFDFDGVVVDSVHIKTEAFAELYRHCGEQIRQQVVEYHLLHGGKSRYEKIRYYQEQLLRQPLDEAQLAEMGRQFSSLVVDKVVSANYIPGALDFIKKMRVDRKLFIVTGTPQNEINEILSRRGLDDYFELSLGTPTKKNQNVQKVINDYDLDRETSLMFGDSLTDYEAAKDCGIDFIGVAFNQPNRLLERHPELPFITDFQRFLSD